MNYEEVERTQWIDGESNAVIYTTVENGGAGTEVWLLEQPNLGRGRLGAGGTHHVAFRVKDQETQEKEEAWMTMEKRRMVRRIQRN